MSYFRTLNPITHALRAWRGKLLFSLALIVPAIPLFDAGSLLFRRSQGCWVWLVVDGDTVRGYCPGWKTSRVRLIGFDTPETKGRCIAESLKAFRATMTLRFAVWTSQQVDLVKVGVDRYGRALARMTIDGQDVAEWMINSGLARSYDGGRREGWCG